MPRTSGDEAGRIADSDMTVELNDVISQLGNARTLMSISCLLNGDNDNIIETNNDSDVA